MNKTVSFISVLFILISSFPAPAASLPEAQKKLYNKNILYYDLACEDLNSQASTPGDVTGNGNVFFLGDSIGLGMRDSGGLGKKILSKGYSKVVLDVATGRSMTGPGSGETTGQQALKEHKPDIEKSDTVVVELGTNAIGGEGTFKAQMQKAVDDIKGLNSNASIYWVKIFSNVSHKTEFNKVMDEVAASETINLIDLRSLNLTLSDGLHPSPSGYDKAATELVDQLKVGETNNESGAALECACPSDTSLEGENNAIKVYNYLIDNMDLTPAQVAGIIGNTMNESGGNTYNLKPTIIGYGMCDPNCFGIVQWSVGRTAALRSWANSKNKDANKLEVQAEYIKVELEGVESLALQKLKAVTGDDESAARRAAAEFDQWFERSSAGRADREKNAVRFFNEFVKGRAPSGGSSGNNSSSAGGCGESSSSATGDAQLKQTITVDKPGKFIELPAKYGCGGTRHRIDSRIAAGVAYLVTKYNMCITAGMENNHNSHGAGLAIDAVPKNGNSKEDWKKSTEAASRAIGWYGDSADDPKGTKNSCANYGGGDYGRCMHEVYPDKFPKWMRWMGYNGAHCHGDPWHIYGGCRAHVHIGWASPNGGDAVSPTVISKPIPAVYTFEAPVPDDLKSLVD